MSTTNELEYDLADPRADSMVQSLRAVGYDLPTAVADLVDNSVSANARRVWIDFHWNGAESHIAIIDDGHGMDADALTASMRIGSRNPLETRDSTDLGRFGLGLKTASFSQARQLSVASKTSTSTIAMRKWDLDYIGETGEWRLLKQGSPQLVSYLGPLGDRRSGTVVLWENLDRLVSGYDVNSPTHQSHFMDLIENAKQHLAMVFHRFLEGVPQLQIRVNDTLVKAWDPFCIMEPATQVLADEALSIFDLRLSVKPYVLPHHSKMSQEKFDLAAGPKKWLGQQGFYVYRNRRLLVGGDWLNLGFQKEDHYKLARIAVDIPNSMDAEWHIDIKKSRAVPPAALRKDLRRIAQLTRQAASNVYRHRGSRLVGGTTGMTFLWEKNVKHGLVSYNINRAHPFVEQLLLQSPADVRKIISSLLSLIEETVPVPTIIIDGSERPDKQARPFENAAGALKELVVVTYLGFRRAGVGRSDAITRIMNLEPFSLYPEIVLALPGDDELS